MIKNNQLGLFGMSHRCSCKSTCILYLFFIYNDWAMLLYTKLMDVVNVDSEWHQQVVALGLIAHISQE